MELKEIVAKNMIELRKFHGYTQLDVAEKLNYSDKSVSKWERAESLPDVETIKKIADLYGVTVDCLLRQNTNVTKKVRVNGLTHGQELLITLIAGVLVWVVATLCYVVLKWSGVPENWATYSFIIAIPLMFVIFLVFNCLWGKIWVNFVLVSAILWTVALAIYIPLNVEADWLCFILPIPIQAAFVFFYGLKILNINIKKKNKENNNK